MKKFCNFINNPPVKAIIMGGLTIIIGIICSAMGTWDFHGDESFSKKLIMLIISGAMYIGLGAYYSTKETNERKAAYIYETQNEAFEELLSGLMTMCRRSSNGANEVIYSIIQEGKANLKYWSFDAACTWACQNVYKLLCKIGIGKDFEVIYDRLDESDESEQYIYANAYANKDFKKPSVYGKKRKFKDDSFHDAELFNQDQSDIEVIIGSEEIDKVFGHVSKEKRNRNKKKYNQYIAIPVFCNDKKMVGLFEIVCLNKTQLGETEEDIRAIISKYFMIYVFFVLVLHKLEKALVAQPL